MSFFDAQNPGIGGLQELTSAELVFLTDIAGLTYNNGDVLTIVAGFPAWVAPGVGGTQWDHPYGDALFTYDVNGNIDTKTVGATVLTFAYDVNGNLSTITDGSNVKTFSYDVNGNLEDIIYT